MKKSGRSIIVTGALGLMGRKIVHAAKERYSVLATDIHSQEEGYREFGTEADYLSIDLKDRQSLGSLFESGPIFAAVHCGGVSHPADSYVDPLSTMDVNIGGTSCLLEMCRRAGVERFIYASTAGVYRTAGKTVLDEDCEIGGNSPYGASKSAAEMIGQAYRQDFGVVFSALRFPLVYGPERKSFSSFEALVRRARDTGRIEVGSQAERYINIIHHDDVADPVIRCIEAYFPKASYNICNYYCCHVDDFYKLLKEDFGIDVVISDANFLWMGEGFRIDAERAKRDLILDPKIDLRTGIKTLWNGGF